MVTGRNASGSISRRQFSRYIAIAGASLILPLGHPFTASANNSKETQIYLDDIDRSNVVSLLPEKISPSGRYAEVLLETLCPEKLATKATSIDTFPQAARTTLYTAPQTGQLFVPESNGDIDPDIIKIASPDLIIDVGDRKANLGDRLDILESETEVPVLYVDASFGNLANAYRTLGQLLGCASCAEEIAHRIDQMTDYITETKLGTDSRKSILICEGEAGLSVRGGSSYQALAIGAVGGTCAANYARKVNSIDVEIRDIEEWNPDIILFTNANCFEKVLSEEGSWGAWQLVPAIKRGDYYAAPETDISWLGSPPLFAQSIGLVWLASILYPGECQFDAEKAASFVNLTLQRSISVAEIKRAISKKGTRRQIDYEHSSEEESDNTSEQSRVYRIDIDERGRILDTTEVTK